MKLWTTEAGFRVGASSWPARIKAGQVSDRPVSALDFLPTFCELAGTQPPKDLALDGTSFLPALEDKPVIRKKPLVWVYYKRPQPPPGRHARRAMEGVGEIEHWQAQDD